MACTRSPGTSRDGVMIVWGGVGHTPRKDIFYHDGAAYQPAS